MVVAINVTVFSVFEGPPKSFELPGVHRTLIEPSKKWHKFLSVGNHGARLKVVSFLQNKNNIKCS
jgi:hypothetical protein